MVVTPPMRLIELRNYRLVDGRRGEFIRYFEEHFLVSQRDEGMHVLGQFAVVDHPDRFVWIRGFADRAARLRGLTGFYDGAFWLARRETANAMIREHHDVHLLRPLDAIERMTGGASLDDRAREPAGLTPPWTGLIVADFYRAAGERDRLVELFGTRVRPALVDHGFELVGHFVAELTPTTTRACPSPRIPPSSSSSRPVAIRRSTPG
jgi:hypothetical protein